MLPLEGVMVVALEQAVAAPLATRHLADLGARVIKIERPGIGDFARGYDSTVKGLSSHFVWLNRSKESLTLDVKRPEAKQILHRLLASADVFIQNLAPGAVERLGFDAAVLREMYPRLIICNVSGYGSFGPYKDKKAYDLLVQAETGVLSVTGTAEEPAKAGISVADIAAGMYAHTGILTALYHRERTQGGTILEVSLFDALGEWMGYPAYYASYGGSPPPRTGAHHATIAPYGPFAAGDGKAVFLGLQNEREWVRFCELVLKRPDLARDSRYASNSERVTNRDALHQIINEIFAELTSEQVIERLERGRIANARLNSPLGFWEHPQLRARHRWRQVTSSAGPLRALLPPVNMEGVEPCMAPIPEVGEHTEKILSSLGYDEEQIERLRAQSVI